jgi:hypothetical protein
MALQNAGRPATARPVNEPPLSCAEADNAKIALNRLQPQAQREIAARLRRQRHVESLHRLGPAPLFHLLTDLDAGKSFWPTVEAYAALSPYRDFILANTGVRPVIRALAGGRAP